MKQSLGRLAPLLAAAFLFASLSACAAPQKRMKRVKCPACGYEFEVPINGGH